jgi:hypothetical protein
MEYPGTRGYGDKSIFKSSLLIFSLNLIFLGQHKKTGSKKLVLQQTSIFFLKVDLKKNRLIRPVLPGIAQPVLLQGLVWLASIFQELFT